MTDVNQIREDLSFVRKAILRRRGVDPRFTHIYLVWAAYVLIGYTLNDFAPRWANWYFIPALAVGLAKTKLSAVSTSIPANNLKQTFSSLNFSSGQIVLITRQGFIAASRASISACSTRRGGAPANDALATDGVSAMARHGTRKAAFPASKPT